MRLQAADSNLGQGDDEVRAVKQAAEEAMKLFLPRAALHKKDYGFEPGDAVDSATLGSPMKLYNIPDNEVLSFRAGNPIEPLLKPTGEWLVPVTLRGTNRAMIEVNQTADHGWSGTGWGLAPLARQWQNVLSCWPPSGVLVPKLIVCGAIQGYLFVVPQAEGRNLTPLSVVPTGPLGPNPAGKPILHAADETMVELRKLLQENSSGADAPIPNK